MVALKGTHTVGFLNDPGSPVKLVLAQTKSTTASNGQPVWFLVFTGA